MESVVTSEEHPGTTASADDAVSRFSVALIDDHPVFTGALATVLTAQPDVTAVWTADGLDEGRRLLAESRPDLAVIDVRLDRDDGLSLLTELAELSPETRAVVLTAHPQTAIAKRARGMGASAVLAKGMGLPELMTALRQAVTGEAVQVAAKRADDIPALTGRETEVLQLLANGSDPHQVARRLGLSSHTVRDHIRSLREKLGVQTMLGAVLEGARHGLIDVHAG
ncbi:MAG: response regulator transcription factor [Micropruina sp.]|uniref:response regulator n=1 Tax=Micropruina sp. TaxID=2737536 RepID=UPI0039E4F70C